MNVTENELLDALREALRTASEQNGLTTQEVATALGVSVDRARGVIKALLGSGQAISVRLMRPNMYGQIHPIFGIQLKKAA